MFGHFGQLLKCFFAKYKANVCLFNEGTENNGTDNGQILTFYHLHMGSPSLS